jgi:CRISPR-associated protein Cas5d
MMIRDMRIKLKVSGDFACFTRPENKVERMSYECPTPSAARNILDSICWRPQMRWIVTKISVLKPIRYQSIRRNDLQSKLSGASVRGWMSAPETFQPVLAGAGADTDATPRNSLVLRDVAYVIEGYPHVYDQNGEDKPVKYVEMFNRRVAKGQCFSQPVLGCREFPARFEHPVEGDLPVPVSLEIGNMLYDIIFRKELNQAVFFKAKIENGVMDADPFTVIDDPKRREALLACSSRP